MDRYNGECETNRMTLSYIECDLCNMLFSKRFPDLVIRLNRHVDFHKTARQQHRNTTNGIPQFKESKETE